MIVELGKVTEITRDSSPLVSAFDGSPFPPLVYYRVCCDPFHEALIPSGIRPSAAPQLANDST